MPVRQEPLDGVAPLDEQHALVVSVLEPEIEDILDAIEPIDVRVGDRQAGPSGTSARA